MDALASPCVSFLFWLTYIHSKYFFFSPPRRATNGRPFYCWCLTMLLLFSSFFFTLSLSLSVCVYISRETDDGEGHSHVPPGATQGNIADTPFPSSSVRMELCWTGGLWWVERRTKLSTIWRLSHGCCHQTKSWAKEELILLQPHLIFQFFFFFLSRSKSLISRYY